MVYNPPYKEKAFKDLDIGIITRAGEPLPLMQKLRSGSFLFKYYCEKNQYNFSFCDTIGAVGWYDDKLVVKSAEDFAKMIPFQPGWRYLDMQKS